MATPLLLLSRAMSGVVSSVVMTGNSTLKAGVSSTTGTVLQEHKSKPLTSGNISMEVELMRNRTGSINPRSEGRGLITAP